MDIQVITRSFEELQPEQYRQIKKIVSNDTASTHLFDEELDTIRSFAKGHFFWIEDPEEGMLAFACCIEKLIKSHFSPKIKNSYFAHDYSFIKDLAAIGEYAFIKQIVVLPRFRKKGYGTELAQKLEQHYRQNRSVMMGAVIRVDDEDTLHFFSTKRKNYMLIDYFKDVNYPDVIWHRLVNIIDQKQFFKSINSDILAKAYRTMIPVQLNLSTRSVNALLKNVGIDDRGVGAEVLWSSFFQLDKLLAEEYGMQNVYNGFYQSLYNSSLPKKGQSEAEKAKAFEKVKETLGLLIDYLSKKDMSSSDGEGVASLSRSISDEAYDFFLLKIQAGDAEGEDEGEPAVDFADHQASFKDFGNPILIDIDQLDFTALVEKEELQITSEGGKKRKISEKALEELLNKEHKMKQEGANGASLTLSEQDRFILNLFSEEEKAFLLDIFTQESKFIHTSSRWQNLLAKQARPFPKRPLSANEQKAWNDLVRDKFAGATGGEQAIEAYRFVKEYENTELRIKNLTRILYSKRDPASRQKAQQAQKDELNQRIERDKEKYAERKKFLEKHRLEEISDTQAKLKSKLLSRLTITPQVRKRWESWIDLHQKLFESDLAANDSLYIWCHAVIPISFSEGLIGVMFTLILKDDHRHKSIDQLLELLNNLAVTTANALSKNIFNIHLKLRNGIMKKYFLKFAVSAIMARNLSHNIGSHVLAKVASIEEVLPVVEPPFELLEDYDEEEMDIKELRERWEEVIEPFEDQLESLAIFNNTLRTRMDLLADISTASPISVITMSLWKDVIEKFNKEEVILTYLSGIENCKVWVRAQLSATNELDIQVPNGQLGRQAFYVIFENIIRNCVKHEKNITKEGENTEIILTVKRKEIEDWEYAHEEGKDIIRYERIVIYDNVKRTNKSLVSNLNETFINRNFIEKYTGKLRKEGWGMLEMKIAANYLRKGDVAHIDKLRDKKGEFPLIKAVVVPTESGNKQEFYLGYELYLKKPRSILVVDPEDYFEDVLENDFSLNKGVRIINSREIEKLPQKAGKAFSHEIALIAGDSKAFLADSFRTLPLRKVYIQQKHVLDQIKKMIQAEDESLFLWCWKKWGKQLADQKQILTIEDAFFVNKKADTHGITNERRKRDQALLDELLSVQSPILFDYHYGLLKRSRFQLGDLLYYEAFYKKSKTGSLVNKQQISPKMQWEIKEAAITQVIVMDERIQAELEKKNDFQEDIFTERGISVCKELALMRIYTPEKAEVNLNSRTFNTSVINKFKAWIENSIQKNDVDFFVIHIGLVEKIYGAHRDKINEFVSYIQKLNPHVHLVFLSGRGNPNYLPEQTFFVHYSNIVHYLIEERSKFHFVKLLYAARNTYE